MVHRTSKRRYSNKKGRSKGISMRHTVLPKKKRTQKKKRTTLKHYVGGYSISNIRSSKSSRWNPFKMSVGSSETLEKTCKEIMDELIQSKTKSKKLQGVLKNETEESIYKDQLGVFVSWMLAGLPFFWIKPDNILLQKLAIEKKDKDWGGLADDTGEDTDTDTDKGKDKGIEKDKKVSKEFENKLIAVILAWLQGVLNPLGNTTWDIPSDIPDSVKKLASTISEVDQDALKQYMNGAIYTRWGERLRGVETYIYRLLSGVIYLKQFFGETMKFTYLPLYVDRYMVCRDKYVNIKTLVDSFEVDMKQGKVVEVSTGNDIDAVKRVEKLEQEKVAQETLIKERDDLLEAGDGKGLITFIKKHPELLGALPQLKGDTL